MKAKALEIFACIALPRIASAQTGSDLYKMCSGGSQERMGCDLYVAGFLHGLQVSQDLPGKVCLPLEPISGVQAVSLSDAAAYSGWTVRRSCFVAGLVAMSRNLQFDDLNYSAEVGFVAERISAFEISSPGYFFDAWSLRSSNCQRPWWRRALRPSRQQARH
jgi:hypothetical protein